jgi:hypothetical protein
MSFATILNNKKLNIINVKHSINNNTNILNNTIDVIIEQVLLKQGHKILQSLLYIHLNLYYF